MKVHKNKEEKKASVSLAAVKEVSVDVAVLSEMNNIFTLKEKKKSLQNIKLCYIDSKFQQAATG